MSSSWLSLEEALSKALAATHVVSDIETISLFSAHRRVVAQDVVATIDVPPWDNSAMDGFAINANSYTQGQALTVQGTITAGEKASTPLSAGHAYKIMTGAPIPDGANTVIMIENCGNDANGNVIIRETSDSNLTDQTARVSRVKTLDGGVVINHSGVSVGDRTLDIRCYPSVADLVKLQTLFENEVLVLVAFGGDVYTGVIADMAFKGYTRITIYLKERVSA